MAKELAMLPNDLDMDSQQQQTITAVHLQYAVRMGGGVGWGPESWGTFATRFGLLALLEPKAQPENAEREPLVRLNHCLQLFHTHGKYIRVACPCQAM